MADLLAHAEVDKLATLLGVEPTELEGFADYGAPALAQLRDAIHERWLRRHRGRLEAMAAGAKFLPPAIAAKIAERAFGPLLSSQVAALVPAKRAAEIAERAPVSFLAATPRYLQASRVAPILNHLSASVLRAALREVLAQGDHVGVAQFAEYVSPDLVRTLVDELDSPRDLLLTGQYIGSTEAVNNIIDALPDARLVSTVQAAVDGDDELRVLGVSLLSRLTEANMARVEPSFLEISDEQLRQLIEIVQEQDAVTELVTALSSMSSPTLTALIERTSTEELAALVPASPADALADVIGRIPAEVAVQVFAASSTVDCARQLLDAAERLDDETRQRLSGAAEFDKASAKAKELGVEDRWTEIWPH